MKHLLPIILISILPLFGFSQYRFQQVIGTDSLDRFNTVIPLTDGTTILAGETKTPGGGGKDGLVVRIDALGNLMWSRTFGGSDEENFQEMVLTSDGGIAILGTSYSYPSGNGQMILVKIDTTGQLIWEHTYGGNLFEEGFGMAEDSDGGFILTGYGQSYGAGSNDNYVIKTDNLGGIVWQKNIGSTGTERPWNIKPYGAGGYLLTGYTGSFGNWLQCFVSRLDSTGTPMWTQLIGDENIDVGQVVREVAGGEILVAGQYASDSVTLKGLLWKLDPSGNTIWAKAYSANGDMAFHDIEVDADGDYTITGSTGNKPTRNGLIMHTDSSGSVHFVNTFGGSDDEIFLEVARTFDGGWVAAGACYSAFDPLGNGYVVKVDSNGTSGCMEIEVLINIDTIQPDTAVTFMVDTNSMQVDSTIATMNASISDSNFCRSVIVGIASDDRHQESATIFPNPGHSAFNVRLPESWKGRNHIRVYDGAGRLIHETELGADSFVQLPQSVAGIYHIAIYSDGKFIQSLRYILN